MNDSALRALSGLALLLVTRGVRAQDPVRLPGVVVKAPVEKPGPRALAGVARDTFAIGIDSVEITIPTLKLRAFTDADGKFRFDKIGHGEYSVRARKIGYAPQVRTVTVDDDGGIGSFELVQLQRTLAPVVVNAARGGLGGVVGDSSFRALANAEVRLMKEGLVTKTDSSGYFHFGVGEGQYFISVRRDGYLDRTLAVRVPKDSGRRVTVFLEAGKQTARQAHNVDDFRERVAWRMPHESSLYSHDDLVDMGIEWVNDVIQGAVTRIASAKVQLISPNCSAVVNGGPGTVMLRELTVDDISSIEVYATAPARPGLPDRPTSSMVGKKGVANSRAALPIVFSNSDRAAAQNRALTCPAIVYVWTR